MGDSIWSILTAIGTLSAVIVALIIALFGEKIRDRIFAPIINISVRNPEGELIELKNSETNIYKKSRYYHLCISNKNKNKAHDAQVHICKIEDFFGPDKCERILWEGEMPLSWIDQGFKSHYLTIGPTEICDLFCITEDGILYILTLYEKINFKREWYGESNFIISLHVKYKEDVSKTFRFHIYWDGKWDDGKKEMSEHFIIKEYT